MIVWLLSIDSSKVILPCINDPERLNALYQYQILDTEPEEAFDEIARLAAQICETPLAFITLIDNNRQWFKSKVRADIVENSLEAGFCPFVVEAGETLIIPDTLLDEKYATNPAVLSEPHVRFYAGVALNTAEGHAIGTLCVLDFVPRELSKKQVYALQVLGRQVMTQLEMRLAVYQITQTDAALIEVTQGVSAVTGEEFFYSLVPHLSRALNVDYAYIGELSGKDEETVKTLAFCHQSQILDNIEYALRDAPCFNVVKEQKICCYPRDVRQLFPHAYLLEELEVESYVAAPFFNSKGSQLGVLGVMAKTALSNTQLSEQLLKIFAVRAGAELERQQTANQLLQDALHDQLTHLPNRALFNARLHSACERSKQHPEPKFALLFLDLDRFKVINDSLGHVRGDQLLVTIAQRLRTCLRSSDIVARLGGDEFTILLEDIEDISDVLPVVERIQKAIALPLYLDGQEVFTTVSIGITLSDAGYEQPEDVLRDADIALYRAKALGKARYETFDSSMHIEAVERLHMETALRRAVERWEFRIHYQPIVVLDTGRLAGFEALVRWQHPLRGLIAPGEFLPVAAETGLNIPIDLWVLREACRQTQQWQEQHPSDPPRTISVNLCSLHFSQPNLTEQIDQILQETNLNASNLRLEITESAIMENSESAILTLSKLQKLGVLLSIDDFGTGYSSLGRLHHFPISMLKIDQSFTSMMSVEHGSLEIVETIITLAQKLGVEVTAEGVETAEQLMKLKALNCQLGQGYFLSRPLDSTAAEALIVANPQW